MTGELGGTIRERVLAATTTFESIDSVLMTTFGFGADFVEEHALAAVLGLEGPLTPARRQSVHEALAVTPVTVVYDSATGSLPTGRYRYLAVPVPVVGRLFHPKMIAVSGRDTSGRTRVWLGVGSGNLTMSGWGRNTEAFADVWIHAADQQPAQVLLAFLRWLGETTTMAELDTSSGLELLAGDLAALPPEALADAGSSTDARDASRLYVSTVHEGGFPAFMHEAAGGSRMRAFSPYWGSVEEMVPAFGAADVQLVPALSQVGDGVGLLRGQGEALPTEVQLVRNWNDDGRRFWHAKAYAFRQTAADGSVSETIAVGSCNFTGPGLRGAGGNVEAMLVQRGPLAGMPDDGVLRSLAIEDLPADWPEDDEPPVPLPVGALVIWDWATESYEWVLDDGGAGRTYELTLPDLRAAIDAGRGTIQGPAPSRRDDYELRWPPDGVQRGPIVEINLHLSPRTFGRRLRASEILDSWRGRPVYVGGDADGDGLGESDAFRDEAELAEDTDELPFDAFDMYEFYRSIRQLDAAVAGPSDRPSAQRAMLVTRPDSVWALAQLAAASSAPAALKLLVLTEIENVASRHAPIIDRSTLERLGELTAVARADTAAALAIDFGDGTSDDMIAWFEDRARMLGIPS